MGLRVPWQMNKGPNKNRNGQQTKPQGGGPPVVSVPADSAPKAAGSSFNALLKTLEEPPQHVKFLLATTDPQKIPVTILSRCLQFNLRRLPLDQISDHLESVMQSEALQSEQAAIKQLARSADGSLRDALSLLDQAIAFSNGQVSLQCVDEMLGTVKSDKVIALLSALATKNSELAITLVHDIAKEAADIEVVFDYLIGVLHGLALYQQFPQAGIEALSSYNVESHQADELIKVFCAEDLQLFYQIAVMGNRDLVYVPDKTVGLEMTVLRMLAFRPATAATGDTSSTAPVTSESVTSPVQQQQPNNNSAVTADTSITPAANEIENNKPGVAEKIAPEAPTALQTLRIDTDWPEIVKVLPISGVDKELAQNCAVKAFNGAQVDLIATPASAPLASKERINRIEKTLSTMQGRQIKINIEIAESDLESPRQLEEREQQERQAQAKQAIESDKNVKSLMSAFDADINLNSIKPIET